MSTDLNICTLCSCLQLNRGTILHLPQLHQATHMTYLLQLLQMEAIANEVKSGQEAFSYANIVPSPQNSRNYSPGKAKGRIFNTSIEVGCDLERYDLPPVGEVDHSRGMCYCYKCSCGKHLCPAVARTKIRALSSTYRSNYSNEFRRHRATPSK